MQMHVHVRLRVVAACVNSQLLPGLPRVRLRVVATDEFTAAASNWPTATCTAVPAGHV